MFLSRPRKAQKGAVLLVMFLVFFAMGTTVFLSSVNTHSVEMRRLNDVRYEMEKARQLLISYAVNYHTFGFDNDGDTFTDDEGPGRLICPDIDNDGLADSNAADCTDLVRGRLPESFTYGVSSTTTVTLNNYYVGIDQQFWYVVDPAFKEITSTQVNNLTTGNLTIDGVGGYIAVIIAPGDALDGQDRAASKTTAANYLEQDNISGSDFINSYPADPDAFNDQVIGFKAADLNIETITKDEIIEAMEQSFIGYWNDNGFLPSSETILSTYMSNNGFRMFAQEGYILNTSPYVYATGVQSYHPYVYFRRSECGSTDMWYVPNWAANDLWPVGVSC